MLIFSKYRYLHVKIASLADVKSCVTMGPVSLMANVWPCIERLQGVWPKIIPVAIGDANFLCQF